MGGLGANPPPLPQWRLIVLRTCTCGVTSPLYSNKLDFAERGGMGSRGRRPRWEVCPPSGPGAKPLSGVFSAVRRGTIKCNFTATPQAGKERFSCLFQIKNIFSISPFCSIFYGIFFRIFCPYIPLPSSYMKCHTILFKLITNWNFILQDRSIFFDIKNSYNSVSFIKI